MPGLVGALAERGGEFVAVVVGDHADRPQLRRVAGVFEEDGASAGGHDDRLADQADVARADEVIVPGDAVLAVLEPVLAAPAVAVELDDLLHEVPGPDRFAVGLDGVHLRAEGREVDAVGPGRGRREDRLAAVDLADHLARVAIEDVVVAGRRADVNVLADHRGRGDVVAVPRPAAWWRIARPP